MFSYNHYFKESIKKLNNAVYSTQSVRYFLVPNCKYSLDQTVYVAIRLGK